MRINYSDGTMVEAMILSRTNDTMRVAVNDGDDAVALRFVNGTWISEDRGPMEIQFEWERHPQKQPPSEGDCICSKEEAARLIQLLFDDTRCISLHPFTLGVCRILIVTGSSLGQR